jgi:hypothetical protein
MIRLARYAGAARKLVADNSPAILTAAAVAGVVTTVYLAVKATPQAHADILNEQSERTDEVPLVDKVKLTYKYYIPAAATGAATIACIVGANTVNTKRSAALASAVGLSEAAFKNYREKVVEHIGATKETAVHDEVMKDTVGQNPPNEGSIIVTGKGKQLFRDDYTGVYFESSMEAVKRAINDTNYQILNEDYASLNDLLRRFGARPSSVGNEVGWTTEKRLEERFSAQIINDDDDDTRACIVISYSKNPIRDYDRFG